MHIKSPSSSGQLLSCPCCSMLNTKATWIGRKAFGLCIFPCLARSNSEGLFVVALQDSLMQSAAFQDVCFLAEAKGPEAWRRKMVFAQESGEAWQQIGTVCMDEVS